MSLGSIAKVIAIPAAALAATYGITRLNQRYLAGTQRGHNKVGRYVLIAFAALGVNSAVELALKGRVGLPATSNVTRGLTVLFQFMLMISSSIKFESGGDSALVKEER